MEFRWANNELARLPTLGCDLVNLQPQLQQQSASAVAAATDTAFDSNRSGGRRRSSQTSALLQALISRVATLLD